MFLLSISSVYFLTGETRKRVLDVPAQLGERELRIPEEQDKEVQRAPGAPHPGVVQVPAADPEQSARKPAQPVLRELPERLVRPQRLHGVRPRRGGHRHVPQDQDREAVEPAEPHPGRREQDVGVLHADGAVGQLAAELARAAAGGDPHQHDRARAAAAAGDDQAAAERAAAHGGVADAAGLAVADHVQGLQGAGEDAAAGGARDGGEQAGQRAAAGARRGGAAAARAAAAERELAGAARGGGGGGARGAARARARAAGRGAGQARGAGVRVRAAVRDHALVVQAGDARVQDLRGVGPAPGRTLVRVVRSSK